MRAFFRRGLEKVLGNAQATIDTIEPGSIVVAPRKPIALDDEAAITEVLDLAAKIGAVLLDSGTGAIDTRKQIEFVAGIYGLEDVDVDVTFNTIMVCARRGYSLPPVISMRTVHYRSLDFTRLAHVDRLVRRIRQLAITPTTAHRIVDEIIAANHPYPYWVASLGWGAMAAGISILLGGTFFVGLTAFITTLVIVSLNRRLARIGTPVFFQQFAGGFIAVMPAATLFHWREQIGIDFMPSQIIAAGIVVLLSGLSLVGSVQDAITGAPITGTARFSEVVLQTGGILAGVALALRVTEWFGVTLPGLGTQLPFGTADTLARITGAAIAAGAFAVGSYAERRAIPVAFGAGIVASGVSLGLALTQAGSIVAAASAAVVVGLVGGLAARRALTPPLVIAVAGITPLLPGLSIYRGLYGIMSGQSLEGFGQVAAALTTGCALAAGVTLGEFLARSLRRPSIPAVLVRIPVRPENFPRRKPRRESP
ncbi:threonine/serine exporter family protein [Gordonia sp. PDNC005]|uniref:threonine/serine ThrE exporter family protein n=1 Tax=unclassified Gordonia (in: high G+C Gram-positive bacteria) TaxID=2657482 RepID=UPI001962E469|nr:threonine/serine exporter family protein [Gordonia sp. PDNC005]QRY62875.1 threonine/serine exporter family protein [Gordonia sp. PDNC005]